MLKKITILCIILIITLPLIYGEPKPIWVTSYGIKTDYDDAKFLTGFGIAHEKGKTAENFETGKLSALNAVSSTLKTKIVSQLELMEEEINDQASSYAKLSIQTSVYLELSGIKEYLSYFDLKEKRYYTLCIVDKNELINDFLLRNKILKEDFLGKIQLINKLTKKRKTDDALHEYGEAVKILGDINQNVMIINYLDKTKADLNELFDLIKQKNDSYEKIKTTKIKTMEDVAINILDQFDSIDLKGKTFTFIPAYYKTTQISSDFFYYLSNYCIDILEKKGAVHKEIQPDQPIPAYIFKGSFYDTDKGYKILYSMTESATKTKMGNSELDVTKKFVTSTGLNILPENIEIALKDHKSFAQAILEESKIKINVWTNKGIENLTFKSDEELEFYLSVNKSGYISILYHLAGKNRIRTPLVENFYIPPEHVYKTIKISDTFEVYPPYGSETAQVFFSTAPMEHFKTVTAEIDGEEYDVLADDFQQFIANKRGLKKKKKEVETAETFISITTVK